MATFDSLHLSPEYWILHLMSRGTNTTLYITAHARSTIIHAMFPHNATTTLYGNLPRSSRLRTRCRSHFRTRCVPGERVTSTPNRSLLPRSAEASDDGGMGGGGEFNEAYRRRHGQQKQQSQQQRSAQNAHNWGTKTVQTSPEKQDQNGVSSLYQPPTPPA